MYFTNFDFWFFYCDIFTNIHATLLVLIVVIILIVVTVQCCGNSFFNSIFLKWFEIWPGLFESRLALTQVIYFLYRNTFQCLWLRSFKMNQTQNWQTNNRQKAGLKSYKNETYQNSLKSWVSLFKLWTTRPWIFGKVVT